MTELDVEAIAAEHLKQCGPCDYGLVEYSCNCPTGDRRAAISRLIDEVKRLRAEALPPGGRTSEEFTYDRKQRRTVYVGPWEPVPCRHGSRWAPPPRDGIRTWQCRGCPETWTEAVA